MAGARRKGSKPRLVRRNPREIVAEAALLPVTAEIRRRADIVARPPGQGALEPRAAVWSARSLRASRLALPVDTCARETRAPGSKPLNTVYFRQSLAGGGWVV